MGSATRQALAAVRPAIDRLTPADRATDLVDAVADILDDRQLLAALAENDAVEGTKRSLVEHLFGGRLTQGTLQVLDEAASRNWSSVREFAQGLQEIAIRALAQASGDFDAIGADLDSFWRIVASDQELELTLSSRLYSGRERAALVDRIFGGRIGEVAGRIAHELIVHPEGRRLRAAIEWARDIVADQHGRGVAQVVSAAPLSDAQLAQLQTHLSRRVGHPISVSATVDPAIVGGLRVELGDEVIDDSAASRLHRLRLQLA